MKFNFGKTFLLGLGFFGVSVIWSVYNAFVPIFLANRFLVAAGFIGFFMTLDNIAARYPTGCRRLVRQAKNAAGPTHTIHHHWRAFGGTRVHSAPCLQKLNTIFLGCNPFAPQHGSLENTCGRSNARHYAVKAPLAIQLDQ